MFSKKRKSVPDNYDGNANEFKQMKKKKRNKSMGNNSQSEFSSPIKIIEKVNTSKRMNESPMKKSPNKNSSIEIEKCIWSPEEDKSLLNIVMKTLNDKSRVSYSKELKGINYENIGSEISKSEAQCKERLDLLVSKGVHIRNLHQVLEDVLNRYSHMKFNNTNNLKKYFDDYKSEIDKYHKKSGYQSKIKSAMELFKNLSPDEKLKYKSSNTKTRKTSSKNVLNIAKSGFDIFCEKKAKSNASKTELIKQFKNLPDSKLLKYLLESLNTLDAELKSYNKILKKSPNNPDGIELDIQKRPTQNQLNILLKHFELPKIEGSVAFYYFNKKFDAEDYPPNKIFVLVNQKYAALSDEKKSKWIKKYNQEKGNYEQQINEWKNTIQSPTLLKLYEIQSKKSEKKVWIEIDKPAYTMSFPNEPKAPPMTPYDLFTLQGKKMNKSLDDIKESFKTIDKNHLQKLKESSEIIIQNYKEKIINFVRELPSHQKSYYLGIKRKNFYKLFKNVDIFDAEYPVTQYPCYNSKRKVAKKVKNDDDYINDLLEKTGMHAAYEPSKRTNELMKSESSSSKSDDEDEDDKINVKSLKSPNISIIKDVVMSSDSSEEETSSSD